MARSELPPPLPPETRTVGQLVAEAVRLYGARFWPSLALGIGPALLGIAAAELDGAVRDLIVLGAGPFVLAASYAGAVALVRPIGRGRYVAVALAVGFVAFLPVCVSRLWIFPGIYLLALAWLALVGLAVPAALVERRGYADALRRGVQLARADYVHAVGSLATSEAVRKRASLLARGHRTVSCGSKLTLRHGVVRGRSQPTIRGEHPRSACACSNELGHCSRNWFKLPL